MPPITPAQGNAIVQTGFDILREASDLTSGRDPNYIRDADPENVFDAIALAAARQGCRRYAEQGENYSENRRIRAERACRPYLDDIGKPPGPNVKLPFRGGQCAGVQYQVTTFQRIYAFADCSFIDGGPSSITVTGPVIGLEYRTENPSGPLCTPQGNVVYLRSGNPVQETLLAGGGYGIELTSIDVAPAGGGADPCGNPPPEVTGPEPDPNPDPPGPTPFPRPPDIDIDIDVEIGPGGDIIIDIGTGPITIDPFGDGGDDPGDPTDPGDPGDPTDPGEPGDPEDTGQGGEASGCAPPGQELVGLLVTVANAPGDANKFANNPRQPYRGIGYVRMGYPGRLGLDISGGTVISPQFFHAQQRGVSCWEVAANTGFDLTVQPFYRDIES